MIYKTEMHIHTSEISYCSKQSCMDKAEAYIDEGYTTVVVTNHLRNHAPGFEDNDNIKGIEAHIDAYKKMKDYAKDRLNVLLGAELSINELADNDYLLYGLSEEFLRSHNDILSYSLEKLSKACRENNVLLIQAHPFIEDSVISPAEYIDGIETFNGSFSKESHNDIADIWANKHNFIKTSGSDHHNPDNNISCGIATNFPITTNNELIKVLRSGDYMLIKTDMPAGTRPR